jgi:hypothetical protein
LPAPPEALLDPETFADELRTRRYRRRQIAALSRRTAWSKSDAELAAEQAAARDARGAAALKKRDEGGELTGRSSRTNAIISIR